MHNSEIKLVRVKSALNDLILDIKARTFPVDTIIMFGSVAANTFNEYSDLDICVVSNDLLSERQQREIECYFSDTLHNEIDVDFTYCTRDTLATGSQVFRRIRSEGRILYGHIS